MGLLYYQTQKAQLLVLKSSHKLFVESKWAYELKGNSTAWKTAFSFPNTGSCQSSLGHLERDRKRIWTLKKSDRKPGIQKQETVGQKNRSKWEGCSLPEQQGIIRSGVQTGGRRWQILAHRALQGMDAQQPVASSFWCHPDVLPGSGKKPKKGEKRKQGQNRTPAFLYYIITIKFFHDKYTQRTRNGTSSTL